MSKHTKKQRQEKAKVKLKAKNKKQSTKLLKGQNVTDTSFKAKKIVIREQLKVLSDGTLAKDIANIQELLTHLNHHNVSFRMNGLLRLKQLILHHKRDNYTLHLSKIIDGVAKMMLDVISEVRKSALEILKIIFSKEDSGTVEPHFHMLQTYMTCAMTHINSSIRDDSLHLLDVLLNLSPKFMAKKANQILPNFFDMLSNAKNGADTDRTLSLHFNKKLTSVQWRLKVLSRLTRYFSVIVSEKKKEKPEVSQPNCLELKAERPAPVINWSEHMPLYIAKFISFNKDVCDLPNVFQHSMTMDNESTVAHSESAIDQEKLLKQHVETIMPIMLGSWLEVVPEKEIHVNTIKREAAVILQFVLETIAHAWECLEIWQSIYEKNDLTRWFITQYRSKIISTLMTGFPYTLEVNVFSPKGTKKVNMLSEEEKSLFEYSLSLTPHLVQQNLCICYLITCIGSGGDKEVEKRVEKCMFSCLKECESIETFPLLRRVLSKLFFSKKKTWSREDFMNIIVRKCQEDSVPIDLKQSFHSILCDIILLPGRNVKLRGSALNKWTAELPSMLMQPEISMKMVKTIRTLASQKNSNVVVNLKRQSRQILDYLHKIKITGISNQLEGQQAIVDIIFLVDAGSLRCLLLRLPENDRNKMLTAYVKNVIKFSEYLYY